MKYLLHLFISLFFLFSISGFAQSETEKGIQFYQRGEYKKALDVLKKATKTESNNAQAWHFLGLSQIGENKLKDAEKSLKKAVSLNSNDSLIHSALAYVYLLRNNSANARDSATNSLKLDKKDNDAIYVLGVISYREGFYDRSYDHAKKIIITNPSFANAYLLKAESLISSFIKQAGTVLLPTNPRSELLNEAKADLEKYLSSMPQGKNTTFYKEYLDSIKFFAEYYSKTSVTVPTSVDSLENSSVYTTNIKVLTKPRAEYTDQARQAGVQGTTTLLVNFSDKGTVKNVLVLKSLGFGLDQSAIRAAQKIRFEPAQKDGKPVSVVKMVQYSFTLY